MIGKRNLARRAVSEEGYDSPDALRAKHAVTDAFEALRVA